MRYTGELVDWNDGKGFGFIRAAEFDKDVFLHMTDFIQQPVRRPSVGDRISFELANPNEKKRPRARHALVAGGRGKKIRIKARPAPAVVFAVLFVFALAFATLAGRVPVWVAALYLVTSCISLLQYAMDKRAAKRGAWRISEASLHLFELLGGWPAALVAQHFIRHKSRKQSYQAVFWLIVVLNCTVLGLFVAGFRLHDLEQLIRNLH